MPTPRPRRDRTASPPRDGLRDRWRRGSRGHRAAAVLLVVAVAAAVSAWVPGGWARGDDGPDERRVALSEALEVLDRGDAAFARVDDNSRTLVLVDGDPGDVAPPDDGDAEFDLPDDRDRIVATFNSGYGEHIAERAVASPVPFDAERYDPPGVLGQAAVGMLPVLLIIVVILWLVRSTGALSSLSGRDRRREPAETPETGFGDVAGCDEAIAELREAVDYLTAPERFDAAGVTPPRGYLLTGPPGTGKTLLARAVAGEAGVPFFAMAGSEFVEVYVGKGAQRVRAAFAAAREHAGEDGRAIVFIDEIDALGKQRTGGGPQSVGTEEREAALNQLLTEIDGFASQPVIVIAATNRADVLDEALTRAGRLERRVEVPLPDVAGRRRILDIYLARHDAAAVDVDRVARRAAGASGADLADIVNRAAMLALRRGEPLSTELLEEALAEQRMGRPRESAIVTPRDREITCWHEAGHAVAALCLDEVADPVQTTIVPRGPSGGATHLDAHDDQFVSRAQARAQLVVAMAGRAAEEILFDGDYTHGSHGDLAHATSLARRMVGDYGMGSLGAVALPSDPASQGMLAERVADAARELVEEGLERARALLRGEDALLAAVVDELSRVETVDAERLGELRAELGRHCGAAGRDDPAPTATPGGGGDVAAPERDDPPTERS